MAGSPPVKAPWPDAIEPKWVHGKRAIVDPDRRLTAAEVVERVCGDHGCVRLDRLLQLSRVKMHSEAGTSFPEDGRPIGGCPTRSLDGLQSARGSGVSPVGLRSERYTTRRGGGGRG